VSGPGEENSFHEEALAGDIGYVVIAANETCDERKLEEMPEVLTYVLK
jgi:hypothetical protein